MKKVVLGFILVILLISIMSFAIAEQNQTKENEENETDITCTQDSDCHNNKICISGECEDKDDEEQEEIENDNGKENKTKIIFKPWQKRNESECLEGCKCVGAVVSCKTETGKNMTITAGKSGKTITITIERNEEEGKVCKKVCKEKCKEGECETKCKEKCKEIKVETKLELEQEREQNQTKLKAKLSNGRKAEIKIMPETASQRALARLRLKVCSEENNCTIELKETGKGNETRLAYELQAERHVKLLGLFKTKMWVISEVDAENGEVIKVKKAWWAFLAVEPEEE